MAWEKGGNGGREEETYISFGCRDLGYQCIGCGGSKWVEDAEKAGLRCFRYASRHNTNIYRSTMDAVLRHSSKGGWKPHRFCLAGFAVLRSKNDK